MTRSIQLATVGSLQSPGLPGSIRSSEQFGLEIDAAWARVVLQRPRLASRACRLTPSPMTASPPRPKPLLTLVLVLAIGDRHPVGDGASADLHLRDGDAMGRGRAGAEPDAGRLVQPEPHRPRLPILCGVALAVAEGERRAALPRRAADRGGVGDRRKHADGHRPLSRGDHRARLFGRFHPQFGQRHRDDGAGLPRCAAACRCGRASRSCCCSSWSR